MFTKFSLGDGNALKTPDLKRRLNVEVFSIVAPRYDWITRIFSFNQDQRWKKEMVAALTETRANLTLDLACGTGDLSRLFASFSDQVIAVDICREMLQLAKRKNALPNLFYVLADMQQLPVPDNSVDWITGGYALRNAPDLSALLKNIYLKLKPGGKAAFLDFSKPACPRKAAFQAKILTFWTRMWGIFLHGNSDVYGYIPASLALFPNVEEIKTLILSMGFANFSFREYFGGFTGLIQFTKPE